MHYDFIYGISCTIFWTAIPHRMFFCGDAELCLTYRISYAYLYLYNLIFGFHHR